MRRRPSAAPLEAVTPAQFDEQFALNVSGIFFTIQKSAPHLRDGGSIVVTTSFLNTVGTPGLSVLSATKAAVRSLVRSIGAELAPRGIRVNAVSPGSIATPRYRQWATPETESSLTSLVPLARVGTPEELASVVTFLASPRAGYVTGTTVTVDGGRLYREQWF